jgi:ketosteroid isomerase-like protein
MSVSTRRLAPLAKPAAALLVLVLLAGCEVERTPRAVTLDADSAARADIRASLDSYQDALLAGDAARAATFFAADSRMYRSTEPDLVGASAVRDGLRGYLRSRTITSLAIDRGSIELARSGSAWELGTWSESFRTNGGPEQTVHSRYVIRWRRGPEATWLIDTFMVNPYPPDSAATR